MFNKKDYEKKLVEHGEMFDMLIDVFTPGAEKEEVHSNKSNKIHFQTLKDGYQIISKPTRHECVVKYGNSVILEVYLGNDYSVCTKGMHLKHLNLDKESYDVIYNSLEYNENYDIKHSFTLSRTNAKKILKAYLNIDENIDNGLVKPGEIENTSKK